MFWGSKKSDFFFFFILGKNNIWFKLDLSPQNFRYYVLYPFYLDSTYTLDIWHLEPFWSNLPRLLLFLQELFWIQMIYHLDILEDQHNCKKYNKNIFRNDIYLVTIAPQNHQEFVKKVGIWALSPYPSPLDF